MKLIKHILLFIIILLTTSCYNYIEVNELAIIEGIGIDYINSKYELIVEVIDIKSNNENSYIIKNSNNTLDEAFNEIDKLSSKELSMSHLETIILSKEVLFNHIDDISNYFINNNKITTNFYLVYTNKPKEVLEYKNDNYPINTKYISDNLDKEKNNNYKFDYIITSIKNNKTIYIPYITIDDKIKIDKDKINI